MCDWLFCSFSSVTHIEKPTQPPTHGQSLSSDRRYLRRKEARLVGVGSQGCVKGACEILELEIRSTFKPQPQSTRLK